MSLQEIKTKAGRIGYIKQQLINNDRWLIRGLLAIYDRQTREEQSAMVTRDHNGVGFTGIDGEILSSFAQQVIRKGGIAISKDLSADCSVNRFFSDKQVPILRRKMVKYARQLAEISQRS